MNKKQKGFCFFFLNHLWLQPKSQTCVVFLFLFVETLLNELLPTMPMQYTSSFRAQLIKNKALSTFFPRHTPLDL